MKRVLSIFLLLMMLCGCNRPEDGIAHVMKTRSDLLSASGCSFEAVITADFSEMTYTFQLFCQADKEGNVSFSVLEPEYIAGIKGQISSAGGKLTFDEVALAFDLQTDDALSPVSGPWIFLRALRSGYIRSYTQEGEMMRLSVNDSYQDDALMLDIWIDSRGVPIQADIYEENCRVLTILIKEYVLL